MSGNEGLFARIIISLIIILIFVVVGLIYQIRIERAAHRAELEIKRWKEQQQ